MGKVRGKAPVCGVDNCRSRRYEEGEDGYLYCENGHQKGDQLAASDEDDYKGAQRTDRTIMKKDKDDQVKYSKYFKGSKAVELYLKSLQLILRHQIWFLVHDKGLPAELETVVQDLWTVRILQLEEKISSQRQEFDSSQVFTASDNEEEVEKGTLNFTSREKKFQETPTLIDCLALCYLGAITLRLPVTPGDIYAWTMDGKMAYRRAIKLLPTSMKDRLPSNYHATLDPNSLLSLNRFYKSLNRLQMRFEIEHGVLWPPLNVPVLLFRYLKELALPLELYHATIRLGGLLEYDFALHAEGKKAIQVQHLPEAQLMACLVVCVKLFYPFDGERRYPTSNAEPTATIIDWKEWTHTMRTAEKSREDDNIYTTEELSTLQEKDVFAMSGNQLDQYLDFYLDTYIDETQVPAGDFRSKLFDLFPVATANPIIPVRSSQDLVSERKWEAVRMVHENMKPRTAIAEDDGESDVWRPGQGYVAYKKEVNLPEYAKVFYEEAAKLSGLTLDMLILAVFSTERRIERWKKRRRELMKA